VRKWLPWEDVYLLENYRRITARKIGEHLGRSRNSVIARANPNRFHAVKTHAKRAEPWKPGTFSPFSVSLLVEDAEGRN
jgi:hypothetical protein